LLNPETALGIYSISGAEIAPSWIQIGKHTYHGRSLGLGAWSPGEKVIIGKYCSIGDQVAILTGGGHRTDIASTYPLDVAIAIKDGSYRGQLPLNKIGVGLSPSVAARLRQLFDFLRWRMINRTYQTTKNTTIGNDVWVGFRAMILGGVTIGDGAVIASGSVVFTEVPPYAIVAGNPAKIIRYRFSKEIVERLLRIAWWDWPDEKISENIEWFYKPINEFVAQFDPQRVSKRA
jgi:virginiamycin A acetyltransferase